MRRRQLLEAALQSSLLSCVSAPAMVRAQAPSAGRPVQTLRFGTTPVFLDDQVGYRDIVGMLRSQELDAAWICGYPWVVNRAQLRGLSIPQYQGEPWYQSYLIVPAKDSSTQALRDLRQRVYAYSDPDSNSGYLVPRATLLRDGIDPDRHFAYEGISQLVSVAGHRPS